MQAVNQSTTTGHELLAVLKWHVDMGLDEVIADEPQDRFNAPVPVPVPTKKAAPAPETKSAAEAPPAKSATTVSQPVVSRPISAAHNGASPEESVAAAQRLASSASTLDELRPAIEGFET